MSINDLRPFVAETDYHVVLQGSGTRGVICARVRVFDAVGKQSVDTVHGRLYDQGQTIPQDPPVGDTLLRQGTAEGNDVYFFSSLPNALAGQSPGAQNHLAVWAAYVGGAKEGPVDIPFKGVSAAQTECELSSAGAAPRESGTQQRPGGVPLATAPLLWSLLAAGFEAGKAVFNGPWALTLRRSACGVCAWDNGGDGHHTPFVELCCESPLATTWRLTLRNGCGEAVEYTQPAGEWNALGPNVLRRSGDTAAAPDTLTVTPG